MGRRRRRRRGRDNTWSMIAIAFGAGLILSACGFGKLALFVAAVILIYVGVTSC